jgi:ATP-dependent RNA helicase RhlE
VPYEPSAAAPADSTPALVRPTPKKQVAALFRSPVKPDTADQ